MIVKQIPYHQRRIIDFRFLLSKFEHVKDRGIGNNGVHNWLCKCPAHQSKGLNTGNLLVGMRSDGHILIHCYGGCGAYEVLAAIGLSFSDLYPDGFMSEHGGPINKSSKLDHERAILRIAAADRDNGYRPTSEDKDRELKAFLAVNSGGYR